jgi:hypothetical protein
MTTYCRKSYMHMGVSLSPFLSPHSQLPTVNLRVTEAAECENKRGYLYVQALLSTVELSL